jgi:hypothetical protein
MKKYFIRALMPFLSALILLFGASCGRLGLRQAWQPPRPVAIRNGTGVSVSAWFGAIPSWMTWPTFAATSGEDLAATFGEDLAAGFGEGPIVGGLLLRDGDLVVGGCTPDESSTFQDCWFVYKQSDGASLELREEDGRLILSGKTISITLEGREGTENCWEWLDQASAKDLRSLRFLMLPAEMDESHLPTLKKLAAANPDLGLGTGSISSSLSAAALFQPHMLIFVGSAAATDMGGFLANHKQLETLYLNVSKAENLDFLATLPRLRRLALVGWDPAKTGPLPKGMRALKSLSLSDSELRDASALEAVPEGIEELSIVGYPAFVGLGWSGTMTSLSGLEKFPNLRTLILNGNPEIRDLSVLKGMKNLAWVGLPPGITQEQFAAFVGEHPAITIVELCECSEITDLSPLRRLTGLRGLIASRFSGELDAVYQLKSLDFLGLPIEIFSKDPDQVAEIRTALPRTLVVPTFSFCLGSGWILLVIPLAALMWIAGSRARRSRRASPRGLDR